MASFLYTFTYKGHTVEYRIMAPSKSLANRIARQQERAWRLAVEFHLKEKLSWN